MLAHLANKSNMGPHGIPMDVATDPANQFKFVTELPTIDFAAHTQAAAMKAYYDQYDTDDKRPMNRAGHLWSVRLKPPASP